MTWNSSAWGFASSPIYLIICVYWQRGSLGGLAVKNPPANAGDAGDAGSIPGSGRLLGGQHGNPLQYSCLGNPMDGGAWWDTVHGVKKELDMTEQLNNSWIIILYFGLQSNATLFSCSTRSRFGDWEFFSWLLCLFATLPHPSFCAWVGVCVSYVLYFAPGSSYMFTVPN